MIHPGQIQAVQEEFSPSQEKVQWATDLISAFDQHQEQGKVCVSMNIPHMLTVLIRIRIQLDSH